MEEVTGTAFMHLLPRVIWRERQIGIAESDCARIGQWLRYYHEIGKTMDLAPLNSEGNWPGLDLTLRELCELGFQNSLYRRLQTFIVPLTRQAVTNVRPVGNVHGDFTVDNVMLGGKQVIVVDVCSAFRNVIDLDIASFLNSLIWLRLTRIVPWSAVARMRKAFLSGYFVNEPVDPLTLTFLQAMGFADVALEIVKRRPSKLIHFWVERNAMAALAKIGV
jgi:Ser/Thr protein kinase RdoA (MazF antagonist)